MPDVFTGKVVKVLSGPTPRSEKIITITKTWEDGVYKGETEGKPQETRWVEVLAIVDEEFGGEKEKIFKCASLEDARKIISGYTYNY